MKRAFLAKISPKVSGHRLPRRERREGIGMRVLVVGGGGREHALAWTLARSPSVNAVWCAPGNPGTESVATNLAIPVSDLEGQVTAARQVAADLVVIGPEAPLAAGLGDRLRAAGVPVVGPARAAARIEASKGWAKELMAAAGIPTATATVVTSVPAGAGRASALRPAGGDQGGWAGGRQGRRGGDKPGRGRSDAARLPRGRHAGGGGADRRHRGVPGRPGGVRLRPLRRRAVRPAAGGPRPQAGLRR